jgi:serine protease AprX
VIAVGASQAAGDKVVAASYSSEGSPDRGVDLLAPGRSIVSLRNPGSFSDTENQGGRTGDTLVRGSGTSQATAVVSGAVALLLQQRPNLTPDQVKAILRASVKVNGTGSGVLDAKKALATDTIYTGVQTWEPSTGRGSLEAARGTSHIVDDQGNPLVGEVDVFGTSHAADGWATDEWTGRSWRDAGWVGRSWRAEDWSGRSWRTDDWYGRSWRSIDGVDTLLGRSWRATDWSGRAWRAERWQGRSWRDNAWEGRSWRADGWEGRSWRGFGAF